MMPRKFSVRESVLLLGLVVLLLFFAYYKLVLQPVAATVYNSQMRQQEAEDQIMLEQARIYQMKNMEKALEEIDLESNVKRIPDYDNMKEVISFLHSTLTRADKYNLTFDQVITEGNLASRTLRMSFVCDSYETAKGIVQLLYNAPYRNEISQVSLQAVNGEDSQNQEPVDLTYSPIAAKITITFYEYVDSSPEQDTE